jgi:hypothetical protein
MQLTNTEVGHSGDGMVTVDFLGEGGEVVSVKMASDNLEGDAAVNRARAMMVQLTAFAEDRDMDDDQWKRSDEELEERIEGLAETDTVLPIASPSTDARDSVA